MHASSSPRRWRAALAGVAATALAGCGTVTEAEGRAVDQAGSQSAARWSSCGAPGA
jgi:hypothetical protein